MIWLTGSAGMLGSELRALLRARSLEHEATDVELDVTDPQAVLRFAESRRPRWIVNCAAYTAVDRAESEPDRADAVNARGAESVAAAAHAVDARLIHVSTDYVFDGRQAGPYGEDAAVAPLGAYGRSKAVGEALVRERCRQHLIVRTAWLHGPQGPNFVATMLRLMAQRQEASALGARPELRVVDDQRGSPTYAADLSVALLALVEADVEAFGTYHYTNRGVCTWYGFAREIQAQAVARGLLRTAIRLEPISTAEYPTPARRPANSVLDTGRIQALLRRTIPTWEDGLSRHLERLEQGRGQ